MPQFLQIVCDSRIDRRKSLFYVCFENKKVYYISQKILTPIQIVFKHKDVDYTPRAGFEWQTFTGRRNVAFEKLQITPQGIRDRRLASNELGREEQELLIFLFQVMLYPEKFEYKNPMAELYDSLCVIEDNKLLETSYFTPILQYDCSVQYQRQCYFDFNIRLQQMAKIFDIYKPEGQPTLTYDHLITELIPYKKWSYVNFVDKFSTADYEQAYCDKLQILGIETE
jgi:hypothetical protein